MVGIYFYSDSSLFYHSASHALIYSYRLNNFGIYIMPTYDFRNKVTGEVFEKFMSIAHREKYLEENPDIEQVLINAPQINCDPIGTNKHRRAFKEVLNKVHSRTSGSVMDKTTEL